MYLWCIFSFIIWINNIQTADVKKSTIKPIWNSTITDMLKRDVFITYDKANRPKSQENSNETVITIKLAIRHIDIDDEKSTMNLFGKIVMTWIDNSLKWIPSDYDGIYQLNVGDSEIWLPDITVRNSASDTNTEMYSSTNCIIENSGTVIWAPQVHFKSYCDLNLKYWPFDKHTCKLILGSLTYDKKRLNLITSYNNSLITELLVDNHKWKINDVNIMKNEKLITDYDEEYINIDYNIIIERRSKIYKCIVILPASIIILMTLANFWLPPQSGEKILLNGINALITVMMLLFFSQKLSTMAVHTPLVVLFYSTSLQLITYSTIISIIVIKLSRGKQLYALPWTIKKILDGSCGILLGLRVFNVHHQQPTTQLEPIIMEEQSQDQQCDGNITLNEPSIQQSTSKGPIQNDWILLATAIDRITFIIYCFIFIILASIYSI